jgi:hypothetical protein
MNKTSKNKGSKTKVLATKRASSSKERTAPLSFKQVHEKELKTSRNTAYSYLIK